MKSETVKRLLSIGLLLIWSATTATRVWANHGSNCGCETSSTQWSATPPCGSSSYAGPSQWQHFVENVESDGYRNSYSNDYCSGYPNGYLNGYPGIHSGTQFGGCESEVGWGTSTADQPIVVAPMRPLAADLRGFYGGFEFLWMRAGFDQNVALIIDPPVGNTLVPFDYEYELTPRAWMGWQSCRGGGFRTTYFRYDEAAADQSVMAVTGATPVFVYVYGAGGNLSRFAQANVGETLTSSHSLKLQALDFEATQQFRWESLVGTVGAGVRLAKIDQHLIGDVRDGGGALQEAVSNDLTLSGAGPTVSLQAARGLGDTRLGVYAGMRGSLLKCETEQKIYEMKGAFTTELEDAAIQREILTVVELSLGLQWTQPMGQRWEWFARGGYESQTWFDAGGPVDSHSTIGLDAISFALGLEI
ncbi:Lpg1974 family pore-forming outer membrane protein [Rubripirellula amarantea]|nr:Lpg1974 family pore-forming outer membrane protein [Rubripirellula amarantea]